MREIKFRAWDKKGKKFVKSVEHQIIQTKVTKNGFEIKSSFILMQFTGLKDKNGKEIYEGDIITYLGYSAYGRDSEKSQIIIEWGKEEAGFDLGWLFRPDDGDIGLCNLEIEIIGNIYENPELLVDEG